MTVPAQGSATMRTRVTLVILGVVALAVLITGLITVPIVRGSTVQVARDRLSAQADLMASLAHVPEWLQSETSAEALSGTLFAVVPRPPRGVARGAARSFVDQGIRAAWAAGESYSGTARASGSAALVEARVNSDGAGIVAALPMKDLEPALGQVTWRILLALILALGVAAVAAVLLARWLTRPLAATSAAARRLAAGERGVAMPTGGSAEASEMSAALGALDRALATSEGRQREFLLSISHEMRTPLSAIRGYGEALADEIVTGAAAADVGRTLVRETERLDRFVADLLELARLEADDFRVEPIAVDLTDLVHHVEAAWSGRAATLGIALTTDVAAPLSVVTDPRRIRQVLDGLVENALRATPPGGRVLLAARRETGSRVVIEVADTGPGFAPDDLAVAFDRGALQARYRDTRVVGTGLGLSIAARLVGRLGGTISVRNSEHGGAVFSVTIP